MKVPIRRLSKPIRLLIGCGLPIVLLGGLCCAVVAGFNEYTRVHDLAIKLWLAVGNDDIAGARRWLDRGADPDINVQENDLLEAMRHKNKQMIDLLLKHGADPSWPLLRVSDVEEAKALIQMGADPNFHPNGRGDTPLMEHAVSGHVEVVRLLLAHGGDVRVKDGQGRTILQAARYAASRDYKARKAYAETIRLLENAGAK